LITFAQGALRSHPYLYDEVQSAQDTDRRRGLDMFEQAFNNHIAFSAANAAGSFVHNLTGGAFASAPENANTMAVWYRQLARASSSFAFVADLTVALLGGGLKTKQKITGRLADALSELYMLACTLKRFDDDGRPAGDEKIVELAARNALYRYQEAISGVIDNFPAVWARPLMRIVVFPLGRRFKPASDDLGKTVARHVLEPGAARDRLTRHIFVSKDVNDPTGLLEATLEKVIAAEPVEKNLEKAIREGVVRRYHGIDWFADAVAKGVLSSAEGEQLREVERLVAKAIAVDHFDPAELKPNYADLSHNQRGAASLAAE
jgi:acyl-CoA dehydrogenase